MSRVPLAVDVALAPLLLRREPERMPCTVYIVVDVIRATTTLCVLFERGCRQVRVAGSIAAARAAAHLATSRADQAPPLLAGEVGGLAPPGFDYGNSPAEFAALDLRGREVIFATTNGTRALHTCMGGGAVLVGAFRNAAAVARAAVAQAVQLTTPAATGEIAARADTAAAGAAASDTASEMDDPDDRAGPSITVVCAGRDQRPAFDDTICAGYLALAVERAAASAGRPTARANGAHIAIAAAESALRVGPRAALADSDAARATIAVGLAADLDWCAAVDACPLVPAVVPAAKHDGLLVVRPWALD